MYLKFSNKNEVAVEAFTLLGASTKRDQTGKIGMFGSGNKYALAYFLRHNYEVRIFSGKEEIQIGTNEVHFGGDVWKVMTVNGKETSITDQSGPDWILWHAIREFYSNSLDEGLIDFEVVSEVSSESGTTGIFVSMSDDIKAFLENMKMYFSFDTNFIYKDARGKILEKTGQSINIFRRGIRCHDSEEISIYDYDLEDIEINESRVLKYDSKSKSAIWRLWITCDNVFVIKEFLNKIHSDQYFEHNTYLNYWTEYQAEFSEAWSEALKGKFVAPSDYGGYVPKDLLPHTFIVPNKLYDFVVLKFGKEKSAISFKNDASPYRDIQQTPFIINSIKAVEKFFEEVGYDVDLPIRAVEFMNSTSNFGKKNHVHFEIGEYLLDVELFDKGLHVIAYSVLIAKMKKKAAESDSKNASIQDELTHDFLNYMKHKNSINL